MELLGHLQETHCPVSIFCPHYINVWINVQLCLGKLHTTWKACIWHTHSEVPFYEAEDDISADEDAGSAYACAAVHSNWPVQVYCTHVSYKVH